MKLKNFRDLIEESLTKAEIAEIEKQAVLELKILKKKVFKKNKQSVCKKP